MKKSDSVQEIKVKNAMGEADTVACIVVQNKIEYTPKVSVIVPVYNVEKYLAQCLDSILGQTLSEIEVICVDDGSTDNSMEILKEYAKRDNRITILSQQNLHAGVARNAGLAVARGEYLSFLDSDDWFDTDMLNQMYAKATKDQSDIVVCDADIYKDKDGTWDKPSYILRLKEIPNPQEPFNKDTLGNKIFSFTGSAVWTKLYARDFVMKNNLFFQNLYSCNDIGMNTSALLLASKISVVNQRFVHYRRDTSGQITTHRGATAISIIHAYYYVKAHMTANNLDMYLPLINELFLEKAKWERSRCTFKQKIAYKKQAKQLMGDDFKIFKRAFKSTNPLTRLLKRITGKDHKNRVKLYKKFKKHKVKKNTILMVEANPYHCECMTGMAKYFLDMGYRVDILMHPNEYTCAPFAAFSNEKIRLFKLDVKRIKKALGSRKMKQYEHLYFNSDRLMNPILKKQTSYYEYFGKSLKLPKGKVVTMVHAIEKYNLNNFEHSRFFGVTLSQLPACENTNLRVVNTHYFGDFEGHKLNQTINFICVGNIESKRKNHSLLFDAIKELLDKGITNFKITVVARAGDLEIPDDIKQYIEFKGRLSYPDMYNELNNADFFLTLMDPENPLHDRYIVNGTSGSYQLIYGFNLPCLISRKFVSSANLLDSKNSIVYETNADLGMAMYKAIMMSAQNYEILKHELRKTAEKIYKESEKNIRDILNTKNKSDVSARIKELEKQNALLLNRVDKLIENFNKLSLQSKNKFADMAECFYALPRVVQQNNANSMYEIYLKQWYREKTGQELNITNPKTYNEKIQWLKLFDATPIKTQLADKYLVRDWVAEKIGEQYLIPLLGVYDCFEDIDFDKLPSQFVIKCNHGSGYNIIVTDKSKMDFVTVKAKLDKWMAENFAFKGCELHYRDIQPKIIIEEYIDPQVSGYEIQLWVFEGQIKFVSFETVKTAKEHKRGLFYTDKTKCEFKISPDHYADMDTVPADDIFESALAVGEKLILDVPYVRIDLIEYNGNIKFREMTFTSGCGLSKIVPEDYSDKLGEMIQIPKKKFNIDTKTFYED
ncbi:MAG: glycosyltransferase [Alphaproteobacteria bacterium]|nr:glycosyltransferase [Alphaproteobacteria bacterium]